MSQGDASVNSGPHIQSALMGYNGTEKFLSPGDFMTIFTS